MTDLFAGSNGEGIFLSTNNGTGWTSVTSNLPYNAFVSPSTYINGLAVSGADLFAVVALTSGGFGSPTNKGIYLSTNNGTSWRAVNTGLTDLGVQSLAVSGSNIFGGTDSSGVWMSIMTSLTTGVKENGSENPTVFALSQNYPNPFNPSTVIQFTVPSNGRAVLKVFNILGQEVATLFDGVATAGEYHQETFDASRLASGIYFSQLEFDGKMQMKKMLLLK